MNPLVAVNRASRHFWRTRGRIVEPLATATHRHRRIAAVLDEFTEASFAPDVELLSLDRRTWPIEIALFQPELLFVESAWRGHRNSWRGRVASYPSGAGKKSQHRSLRALVRYCRVAHIPSVFWNKEDPVHYGRFIAAAGLFDAVMTTATEKEADYRRDCDLAESRTATLSFAAQPALYSPLPNGHSLANRDSRVLFAGSYGEAHFPHRRKSLEYLLDGALAAAAVVDSEVVVFDRNQAARDPDKCFPARFASSIRGGCSYFELAGHYQRAAVGLNVNSVTDSSTMYSRRVVEMLACGLPVVSTPSVGLSREFAGIVSIVENQRAAQHAITRLLTDSVYWREISRRGIEIVAKNHTMEARIDQVFKMAECIQAEPRQ